MAGMPDIIAKPSFLKRLDALLDPTSAAYDPAAFLVDLQSTKKLAKIARGRGVAATQVEEDHLADHWFSQAAAAWWSWVGHKERIVRKGLIKAVQRSRKTAKPLDSYWVCSGLWSNVFQVSICESAHQITLTLHTPVPPYVQPGTIDMPRMWLSLEEGGTVKVRRVRDAQGVPPSDLVPLPASNAEYPQLAVSFADLLRSAREARARRRRLAMRRGAKTGAGAADSRARKKRRRP
jgi:hypothetical protein